MNWIVLIILILIILALIYLWYRRNRQAPSAQVVNNSNSLIHMVKVGSVEFNENLAMCGTGCSTGFIDVSKGSNKILLQEASGGAWLDLGDIGPFADDTLYAVNIKTTTKFCAELWKRNQADSAFNDDTSKELITSNCG